MKGEDELGAAMMVASTLEGAMFAFLLQTPAEGTIRSGRSRSLNFYQGTRIVAS